MGLLGNMVLSGKGVVPKRPLLGMFGKGGSSQTGTNLKFKEIAKEIGLEGKDDRIEKYNILSLH